MEYLKLAAIGIIIVAVTALLYQLEKKTAFAKYKQWQKQLIFGLIFGGLAAFCTEFGVPINGAVMNVRDAAPLCASLIFGAPAGIIAGITGGIERYFAVYWGAGTYTRIACTIATIIAGFVGALLRKFMFDDKKPAWYYGLATGLVMEVLHMLMIFLTNMNDVSKAFSFVQRCTIPMMSANGLTVMLALLTVSLLSKERLNKISGQKKLAQSFQRWLLLCVLVAFSVTSLFTFIVQTRLSISDAENVLKLNINDVRADIEEASNKNLLSLTRDVASDIQTADTVDEALLNSISSKKGNDFSEINVVDKNGIITASTVKDYVGFDMHTGVQSSAFLVLNEGTLQYVQSYQPTSNDSSVYMKYAGVALGSGGFVQVGYNAGRFQKDIDSQVSGITKNRHVGKDGSVIIADISGKIVSDSHKYTGQNLSRTGINIDTSSMPENTRFESSAYGSKCYCMYVVSEGYYIISVMPVSEVVLARNVSVYVSVFMEICVFTAIFILIYFLIKKLVVENIQKVNGVLGEITGGNLNVSVNVRTNEEFASLSDDINSTVVTLKRYIAEAAARIDKELEFARAIQLSALPSIFPPFPERTEFDLFAQMFTAKEVGGDFYDYFFVDKDHLALVIADVSGKGIPASLFMMKSKTLIKSLAESGTLSPSVILSTANRELCDGNDAEMFVTVWLGIYSIPEGKLTCSNAGHEYPAIKRKNGVFEMYRDKHCFVLAGMENAKYREYEIPFAPGDCIFLYTDGVTEATDAHTQLYGEERLLSALNASADDAPDMLIPRIKKDIDAFVENAPQFDDITMIALKAREDK